MIKFIIEQHSSKVCIRGELTRHTINKKNCQSMEPYFGESDIVIDLSAVSKIDTAGLAWLLSLVEQRSHSGNLHFSHLNGELVKLAKLSGVDSFLPTLY